MIIGFDQEPPRESVGCKGHNLCRMWRAGLPVPAGFCVTWDGLEELCPVELDNALEKLDVNAFAVRSSAIQEDAVSTSYAGILVSRLNITSSAAVLAAIDEIRTSALAPAAVHYSERRNVNSALRIGAIVQTFISAEASGVLFMRDPLTGGRQMVVEACWGLGSAVVEGLVRPDRWVIAADGNVISSHIADKDIAIVPNALEGTIQMAVDPACRRRACINPDSLELLARLAHECERLFGSPQDIEWAVSDGRIWLLQSRPITSA